MSQQEERIKMLIARKTQQVVVWSGRECGCARPQGDGDGGGGDGGGGAVVVVAAMVAAAVWWWWS